ncbi:MAG TPA: hypothetical protein VGH10_08100 [Actinomycetota bacterium]|jgi:hypothetical protein
METGKRVDGARHVAGAVTEGAAALVTTVGQALDNAASRKMATDVLGAFGRSVGGVIDGVGILVGRGLTSVGRVVGPSTASIAGRD